MNFNTNKEKGNAGLSMAIAYFASNGYAVSIPLNDTQDYDLIVDKEGMLQRVQCKATGNRMENGSYELLLASSGGTKGDRYKTLIETNVELLFALREDGIMYVIPVKDLKNVKSIRLITEKNKFAHKDYLDTSQYIVTF